MMQRNNQTLLETKRPDLAQPLAYMNQAILLEGLLSADLKQNILVDIILHEDNRYAGASFPIQCLMQVGVSSQLITRVQGGNAWADAPTHYQTLFSYARQTAQTPELMTKADQQPLYEAGLTEGEIVELSMLAALANFLSTWLSVTSIPERG